MVRHAPDGRRVMLLSAVSGESFAEAALFSDTYHCDAVAEVASGVTVVPKVQLRAFLSSEIRRLSWRAPG